MTGELVPTTTTDSDPAQPPTNRAGLALGGDRGVLEAHAVTMEQYLAFGAQIAAYQREHPNTIVRTTQRMRRHSGVGTITVRWWPRGEEQPR